MKDINALYSSVVASFDRDAVVNDLCDMIRNRSVNPFNEPPKAGLAAFLEVARLVVESKVKLTGDLIIAGIADEEWQLAGSRDIGRNGPKADFGIVGKPTKRNTGNCWTAWTV